VFLDYSADCWLFPMANSCADGTTNLGIQYLVAVVSILCSNFVLPIKYLNKRQAGTGSTEQRVMQEA
jgi:hypothetical protein